MILFPFAIAIGVAIALATGGNLEALTAAKVRALPVLAIGAVLVLLGDLTSIPGGIALLIIGNLVVIVGLAGNLHLAGVITIAIGLLLNVVVMVANAHVPVRLDSMIASGEAPEGTTLAQAKNGLVDPGAVREFEDDGTRLSFLGDIVPIGVLDTVVSFGDLIAAAGLIVLTFRLLTRKPGAIDLEELFDEPEIDLREPRVRRTQPGRPERLATRTQHRR